MYILIAFIYITFSSQYSYVLLSNLIEEHHVFISHESHCIETTEIH